MQVEHSLAALSLSLGLASRYSPPSPDEATDATHLLPDSATDTTCLLPDRATETTCLLPDRATYSAIAGDTMAVEPDKTRRHRNRKLELTVLWLSAFFTGCCNFTFNVTIADYLGKVVHKGQCHLIIIKVFIKRTVSSV